MNEGKRGYKVIKHVATPKLPATKPRNFVAKNATTSGAGAHKDKKKSMKQGDHKHKKTPADMLEGATYEQALSLQLKIALVENLLDEAGHGANRDYRQGFASPTAPSLGGRGREDDEGNSEFDDKMRALTGKIFYNVNDPETAMAIGLKQTRTGKWYLPVGNRHAQKTADNTFGPGKVWYPKNEGMAEGDMYGDKEVSWEKGGRRAPTGAFRNPAAEKSDQTKKKPTDQSSKGMSQKEKSQQGMAEEYNAEYDDEAGMVDNNLETMKRAVVGLDNLIKQGDNLPEWCQEKIAVAKSMLVAVWDYMASEEQGVAEGLSDVVKNIKHKVVGDPKDGPRKTMGLDASLEKHADDKMKELGHKFRPKKQQGVAEGLPKDPKAPTQVRDRKTGKMYNPTKEFDKTMNKPEVKAQMQRMAKK